MKKYNPTRKIEFYRAVRKKEKEVLEIKKKFQ